MATYHSDELEEEKKEDDELEEFLTLARERFDECITAENDNRILALEDLRFRAGDQWPESVKRDRDLEGRPCLTLNRIPTHIRQVVNDIRQMHPSITVKPIDSGSDPETARIMSGMIKAIESSSNAEIAYDWAVEYAVIMGWGFFRITTKYQREDSFDQVLAIERVNNHFSVFPDPGRSEPDGSDMRFCFVMDNMDRKDFEAKYPGAESEWDNEAELGTHRELWYVDDKVRVAEYWVEEIEYKTLIIDSLGNTRLEDIKDEEADCDEDEDENEDEVNELEGVEDGDVETQTQADPEVVDVQERRVEIKKITQYIITGKEILEENEYQGQYIPIVIVLGEELNIEGELKLNGMVRALKDPQRQYNYWRTASTERVALAPKAPYIGPEGAFRSPKWELANTKNYAYLEYTPKTLNGTPLAPPRREMPPDVSPGFVNEIQTTAEELKAISGQYDTSLGAQGAEISGKAINAKVSRGNISNYHYSDNLIRAKKHAGRILVDLIPKIYDNTRIINILNPDGTEEPVQINQEYLDPQTQKYKKYDLKAGRYDVAIDVGPSFTTQRETAVEAMSNYIKADPASAPLLGDLIVKAQDWPQADEAAKRLRTRLPAKVIESENPQVQQLIRKSQEEVKQVKAQAQQSQQYTAALEQAVREKDLQLKNKADETKIKQGDLKLKYKELERKYLEMENKYKLETTKMAIGYKKDVL